MRLAGIRRGSRFLGLVAALLLVAGCFAGMARPSTAQADEGVATLTGSVTVSNPIALSALTEPYILLMDMTAFIERDRALAPPLESEVIGPLDGDISQGAAYTLNLPIDPKGTVNDVAHGAGEAGVQVYSVEFSANIFGDPFGRENELTGWGTALSSLQTVIGTNEVTGGSVVVYAAGDGEQFPTGFGADGKLFTDDDPVGPIPAGWTVVDLNSETFAQKRDATVEVPIIPGDEGFFDYSQLSYTEAFDKLVADLELRYPFTELKGIDFEALKAKYRPQVEAAEAAQDPLAFNIAIVEFANEFPDGHVGASTPPEYIAEKIGGRLGMRLAETDDGKVIVISVTEGLPANLAGIELGAEITTWGGKPVTEAVAEEVPIFTQSTPFAKRLAQYEFLTRGAVGDTISVGYVNPGGSEQTADLTFSEDIDGRDVAANTAVSLGDIDPGALPLTATVLDSGLGYIRITTFDVDPVLLSHAWEWALNNFMALGVTGLIVDMRDNPGGLGINSLYLAGSFYGESFDLDTTYANDDQGNPIEQEVDRVDPAPVQWTAPVAVLIDSDCYSACEIFTAAMAHDSSHLIVGYTPTAGVEASVYFWALPGDVGFQAPTGALMVGTEVFLEGVGVPPNVQIPATEENLLDPGDEVLAGAEEAVNEQVAALQAAAEASPEASPAS